MNVKDWYVPGRKKRPGTVVIIGESIYNRRK